MTIYCGRCLRAVRIGSDPFKYDGQTRAGKRYDCFDQRCRDDECSMLLDQQADMKSWEEGCKLMDLTHADRWRELKEAGAPMTVVDLETFWNTRGCQECDPRTLEDERGRLHERGLFRPRYRTRSANRSPSIETLVLARVAQQRKAQEKADKRRVVDAAIAESSSSAAKTSVAKESKARSTRKPPLPESPHRPQNMGKRLG